MPNSTLEDLSGKEESMKSDNIKPIRITKEIEEVLDELEKKGKTQAAPASKSDSGEIHKERPEAVSASTTKEPAGYSAASSDSNYERLYGADSVSGSSNIDDRPPEPTIEDLQKEDCLVTSIIAQEALVGDVKDAPAPPPDYEKIVTDAYDTAGKALDGLIRGSVSVAYSAGKSMIYYGYDSFIQNGRSGIYLVDNGQARPWNRVPLASAVQMADMLPKLLAEAEVQQKAHRSKLAAAIARTLLDRLQ